MLVNSFRKLIKMILKSILIRKILLIKKSDTLSQGTTQPSTSKGSNNKMRLIISVAVPQTSSENMELEIHI